MTELADRPASYPVHGSVAAFRSGRVIEVRTDVVGMPDGSTATRDVVVHPGAVGVIALDDRDRVLLVQQYRHPAQQLLWEPPAGLLDQPGEDPLDAAKRELFEEAHYRAGQWGVLVDAFTSPGMTSESVRVYLARELSVAEEPRHAGEAEERDMPVAWLPLEEAVGRVLGGSLHNPMAIMGVLTAASHLAGGYSRLRRADAPWPTRPQQHSS